MNLVATKIPMSFWSDFFLHNRAVSGSAIILIYIGLASLFAYLISDYIKKIYKEERTWLTPVSSRIVGFFEKILGESSKKEMNFREYFTALLIFNAAAGLIAFFVLYFQNYLPFAYYNNRMTPSLMFNTIVSFLTNTNLQHYSNPLDLSYFSQTFVIMGLMFLASGTGFAASMAFIRGILNEKGTLGNFYHDFLVSIFDLLLPLTILVAIVLILLGIPQTLSPYISVTPVFSTTAFKIPMGPIATFEAIKNLGSNGGGFYGSNAAFPFANPNWMTNLIEYISFMLIPLGSLISLGKVFNNRKFGTMLYSVIITIFVFSAFLTFFGEFVGIPAMSSSGVLYTGNMLGKETALGLSQTSIFATGATLTSTGASNRLLLTYTPAGILGVMLNLMLNDPLGGVGTCVLNIFMFVIFTVFITSLMVGKLPELMSLKIGSKEIKYSTLSLITHPLLVMIPLGLTLMLPHIMASFINPQSNRITELLYEFGSSASNNGSELGGFLTNQTYFNVIDAVLMILGRYMLMGFQLLIAQSFSYKTPKVQTERTIDPGSFSFGLMLLFSMLLIGLLSFFPIFALGPLLTWAKDFGLTIMGVI